MKRSILLFVLSCVALLTFLGVTQFNTKGEPREAIVAVTMLDSGNWILPTNNGGDMAYKPPFFHWCIAMASSVTGKVTEFTSRVPSAVALIVLTMATYLFYNRRRGSLLAMITALVVLTNFEVHRAGFACRVDMVLTTCIVLAMFDIYRWIEREFRSIPILAIVAMGLATLTKGPVGVLLPCLVGGTYMLIRKCGFWRSFARMSVIGILALVIPAIWYYAAYKQGGKEFVDLVMEENFGRFTGTMSYESHVNPWYYNVEMILAGLAPYTILLLMSLFVVKYKKIEGGFSSAINRLKEWIAGMDNTRLYSMIAFVMVFVFYCIPKSKRGVYLLPMYPFMSYFIAELIVWLTDNKNNIIKAFTIILGAVYGILFVAFCVVRCSSIEIGGSSSTMAIVDGIRNGSMSVVGWAIALLPILFWTSQRFWVRMQDGNKYYIAPLLVLAIYFATDGVYQPLALNAKADRASTDEILKMVPSGPIYSFLDEDMLRFYVINFYSGNRVLLFEKEHPQEGHVLLREREAQAFMDAHKDYSFEKEYKSKLKGCDVRDFVELYRFNRLK